MILLASRHASTIAVAAEAAYPKECCGLLVGRGDWRRLVVTRVEPSLNIAAGEANNRFEVDPALRFRLMRALGDGPERIVGHYHSHPDAPARPSATDIAMAFEPDLAWLIVPVAAGCAAEMTAWRLIPGHGFRQMALRPAAEKT